jgi:RNA polymerase sigma-70 factor, ECF subfamily
MFESRSPFSAPSRMTESSARDDKGEFVRLLVKHEPYLRGYILSLEPSWTDVEEIFQNTCVRLWRQVDEWDPGKSFRAWACTVAYYEVLSHRKANRQRQSRFGQAFLDAIVQQHADEMDEEDSRSEAMRKCLDKLSPEHRRILDLTYRDDLAVEQIAELSKRTVATTYKSLARIRKVLRDCVERTVRMLERE